MSASSVYLSREGKQGCLEAVVNPAYGAEVSSLKWNDRELLARMPWQGADPQPLPDQAAWTAAWSGGWQLLFPNAGKRCFADGRRHGFHGSVAQTSWRVVSSTTTELSCEYRENAGFHLARTYRLTQLGLVVHTTATNHDLRTRHCIAVEHLILGSTLLDADAEIEAPGTVPMSAPFTAREKVARFGAVTGAQGSASFAQCCSKQPTLVQIRWDETSLGNMWFWQEVQTLTTQPWYGQARALGLEPASVPSDAGLAAAMQRRDSTELMPGQSWSWWVAIEVSAVPGDA
ncbi:MAG: hypothetical protein QOH56_2391 [Pseudonocardiales bacterium]|jgi:galactose mutarotase-like enzyme|nr:hypothetical protein [Pseudonocardiales bacterium]